ncbi:MAG: DUF6265 family protein [Gammaproteobacteria bacterium]
MKHELYVLVILVITVTACTHTVPPQTASTLTNLTWLEGCWQTGNGVEESWMRSKQGDQLFGYSVTTKAGQRVFFEQLRIDLNEQQATLFAYPKGIGPTPFDANINKPYSIEFINAENDYPQRIRYSIVSGRIEATISLLDNTNMNTWSYERCD